MQMNRGLLTTTSLLSTALMLLALPACPEPDPVDKTDAGGFVSGPEPAQSWDAPGQEDLTAFAWGLQTGDATPNSVIVSLRSLETSVDFHLVEGLDSGWSEERIISGQIPVDDVVQLTIDGLKADTTYALAAYSTDGQRRSPVARFRSALPSGASRIIRFGATSGLGGNEPWPNLSRAAEQKLDFFMLVGDTIYADNPPAMSVTDKWKTALSTQGLIDLTTSTSMAATWDDHEVANNWSYDTPGMDGPDGLVQQNLRAYRQAIPQGRGPGGTGIWRKLSWGAAMDLLILDSRGERRDGNYISPEQMQWLKEQLSASTARFKIINNSVPITDFSAYFGALGAEDRWQGYPAQRNEIIQYIDNNNISGVLWVSGDLHVGGVGHISAAGDPGASQWEALTGPSGSPISIAASHMNVDERMPVVVKVWNYTRFTANPDDGSVHIEYIADDGSVIDDITVNL